MEYAAAAPCWGYPKTRESTMQGSQMGPK